MVGRGIILKSLVGGGASVVLGAVGIVVLQGLWAVAHAPSSIGQVMFGG